MVTLKPEVGPPYWAKRVVDTLKEQGRSLTWLAKEIGVLRSNLSHIMRGTQGRRPLTEEQRQKMAHALGVTYRMIFGPYEGG